ncbi:MAG: hypothetical protein KBD76_14540 [Bacteriovorax sp.]|nr:hypothetical protein [Bacteriovorax sp.]
MFTKSTLFFTSAILLLGPSFSAHAMLESEIEEKKDFYFKAPQKDPLVEEHIIVANHHVIFGKKNEFALFYDEKKQKTLFFRQTKNKGIVKIAHEKKDSFYIEYEDGEQRCSTSNGSGGPIPKKELEVFKERVENLNLHQQMEKLQELWKPLNQERTAFSLESKRFLYLSQIVDNKLYFFSKRLLLNGQFTPISCPTSSHEGENWTFATKHQVFSFWRNVENNATYKIFLIGDLKDVELEIKEKIPEKDKNSEFILYGDNNSSCIRTLKSLNGISVSELEKTMAPENGSPNGSLTGFLASGESLLEVMDAQNETVKKLGLTHGKLVEPLQIIHEAYDKKWINNGVSFLFHNYNFTLQVRQDSGSQESPFYDDIPKTGRICILHNLSIGELCLFSPMVLNMAEKCGFYEGNVPHQVPPEKIVKVCPWLVQKKEVIN